MKSIINGVLTFLIIAIVGLGITIVVMDEQRAIEDYSAPTAPIPQETPSESHTETITPMEATPMDANTFLACAYMEYTDIMYSHGGFDIEFKWNDGKFDVVYDANKCTESAAVFLEEFKPYLNHFIEEKAKELIGYEIIEMNVSAYCDKSCCCGEYADGITASGSPAKGLLIAAPPEYPFGTVMDVEGYGVATVQDRGGVIKGNRLDLLFPTHQEALNWGRRTVMVKLF